MAARDGGKGGSERRGVVAGTAVIVVSLAVLIGCVVWYMQQGTAVTGIVSDQQFRQVRIGAPREDVLRKLGTPAQGLDISKFPLHGQGADCVYYSESDALMDPAIFQFCFVGGRLSIKQSSGLLPPSPAPTRLIYPSGTSLSNP